MEENKSLCKICEVPCSQKCANCNKVSYCSKPHQKLDWPGHKKDCHPFEIQHEIGKCRKLVAAKKISVGDKILTEKPIINLPSTAEDEDDIICVGCSKVLDKANPCSKCSWPVCGPICEMAEDHANYECKIVAKFKTHPRNSVKFLPILRCLFLKTQDPTKYSALLDLESHIGKMTTEDTNIISAIAIIRGILGLKQFTEVEIAMMQGVINTNALSQMTDVRTKQNLRQSMHLYAKACLANHSCVPNVRPIIQNSGLQKFIATRPIFIGDEITITYVTSVAGNVQRQASCGRYHFFCKCPRCSDPTELGTHFSSIKCQQRLCPGYLLPHPIHSKGISTEWVWNCDTCSTSQPDIDKLLAPIKTEMRSLANTIDYQQTTVQKLEGIIDKYQSKILHPNHYLLFAFEGKFIEFLSNMIQMSEASLIHLCPKEIPSLKLKLVTVAKKLLQIADKLFPGPRLIRGRMLYFLCIGLRNDVAGNEICKNMTGMQISQKKTPEQSQKSTSIIEFKSIAEEARDILSLEPDGTDDVELVQQLSKILNLLPE